MRLNLTTLLPSSSKDFVKIETVTLEVFGNVVYFFLLKYPKQNVSHCCSAFYSYFESIAAS